jgi:hypothetical protein
VALEDEVNVMQEVLFDVTRLYFVREKNMQREPLLTACARSGHDFVQPEFNVRENGDLFESAVVLLKVPNRLVTFDREVVRNPNDG